MLCFSHFHFLLCINSSKVYCKCYFRNRFKASRFVLIVAKCIVNIPCKSADKFLVSVLIVAKCIVNTTINYKINNEKGGINSSKVYCK